MSKNRDNECKNKQTEISLQEIDCKHIIDIILFFIE